MKITLENLSKKYNREWIFKDLNYSLEQGKSYAITGPNGCGKSTLLRIIAGAMPASKGKVCYINNKQEIDGDDIYEHICISAPYMELVEELTLIEMLKFHFKFKPITSKYSISDLVELMYLNKSRNKQVKHFSSGMKQRLKLGLAFFSNVPILLLDEPTSNLDSKGIDWYLKHINDIKKDKLLVVASNQEYEHDFCTSTINLNKLIYK